MKFAGALALASLAAVTLFLVGVLRNDTVDYWYLLFNLLLALLPLGAAWWLHSIADTKG